MDRSIFIGDESHIRLAPQVVELIKKAHDEPGAALSLRSQSEIEQKIRDGKAVIATTELGIVIGFLYISPWQSGKFVSTSALVVSPEFRGRGIATQLKIESLNLIKRSYPDATPFGITLSNAVMRVNASLGFIPVAYSEITNSDRFWSGCATCPWHETLLSMKRERCFCTAMILPKSRKP